MAQEKKKTAAGKKRPAAKKEESSRQKQVNVEAVRQKNQARAVIMFAVAILLFCLILIRGESLWKLGHNFLCGMFGGWAILWPLLLLYIAVITTLEKRDMLLKSKLWMIMGIIVLCSVCGGVFAQVLPEGDFNFGQKIDFFYQYGYQNGKTGLIGGLLALPLRHALGKTGACIVVLLLLFVMIMILTGTTLLQLYRTVTRPVNAVSKGIQNAHQKREEENRVLAEDTQRRREAQYRTRPEIDVSLDEPAPQEKKKPAVESLFPTVEKSKVKKDTTSRDRLLELLKKGKKSPTLDKTVDIPIDAPQEETPPVIETVIEPVTLPQEPTPVGSAEEKKEAAAEGADGFLEEDEPFVENWAGKKKTAKAKIPEQAESQLTETGTVLDDAARMARELADKKQENNAVSDGTTPFGQEPAREKPEVDIEVQSTVPATPQTVREKAEADTVLDDAARAAREFMRKKQAAARAEEKAIPEERKTEPEPQKTEPELPRYVFPPITMLSTSPAQDVQSETEELQTSGRMLVDTLKSFGVQTRIVNISRGPAVTRYELQPAAGVKISKITGLSDDIAMNLAATGVRIEAPIPGKAAVGIEVPNKTKTIVRMRELIESNSFCAAKSHLTVALGRDIAGQVVIADLAKMPHLLIAGTTGSGKSVCINSMIVSLLYKSSPEDLRLLMIDPKVVELGIYAEIPHLLIPVVTDPKKAAGALNWAVNEMLKRYRIFADKNVRDIAGYNAMAAAADYTDELGQPMPKMPHIVIIIDELSDLMMASPAEVEDSICRLAQMARAAGMHLVVATQRPSVDVVTGLIKANIPSRIAFAVSSAVDSRTILDGGGAEKLLGQGDMLFAPVGAQKPQRVQGCFVSDGEIESIANFVKKSHVEYDTSVMEEVERNAAQDSKKNKSEEDDEEDGAVDPMLEEAIKCVVEAGQASTSQLQRRLRLGYARAGRLIDEMEQMGVVGPHEGSKPRQVLMTYQQWLERNMQS